MFFGKPKPTVTPEDQEWIEEAFLWFEKEYTKEYLLSVPFIEPTKEFFPYTFTGKEEDAEYVIDRLLELMEIKGAKINLYFFSDKPMDFSDEGVMATSSATGTKMSSQYALGKYSEAGRDKFQIGVELSLLKNPLNLIATIAHELSHLILLGEGRLQENDEELTDLNCIAMGFGIFISNSIFTFQQWQGNTHQGWSASRSGYIPEEVASYALALMQNYRGGSDKWAEHLNPSMKKKYKKNMKYLSKTEDKIKFMLPHE